MKVKALTSFAGPVTMFGGETRNITDEKVLNDLIKCGYVEAVEDATASPPPAQNNGGNANAGDDGNANAGDDGNAAAGDGGNANAEDDGNAATKNADTKAPKAPKNNNKGKNNK